MNGPKCGLLGPNIKLHELGIILVFSDQARTKQAHDTWPLARHHVLAWSFQTKLKPKRAISLAKAKNKGCLAFGQAFLFGFCKGNTSGFYYDFTAEIHPRTASLYEGVYFSSKVIVNVPRGPFHELGRAADFYHFSTFFGAKMVASRA